MAFDNEATQLKYGQVTIEFLAKCAKELNLDLNDERNLRVVLHSIGFKVSTFNEETQEFVPCRVERFNNVNVRCIDRPYEFRKTTVFSGVLRDKTDFPNVGIYDNVDILDVVGVRGTALVSSLDFDIPSVEKVNTRKYTKRGDRGEVVMMDLPDLEDVVDNRKEAANG